MKTSRVIHIKDSKGTPDEVYIGRAGKGNPGYFGNPIKIGQQCSVCKEHHSDGGSTLPCYEKWLRDKMRTDPEYMNRVYKLKDKTLVCFCKPNPCHGDILSDYVDMLSDPTLDGKEWVRRRMEDD